MSKSKETLLFKSWGFIEAIDDDNEEDLNKLESQMAKFYSQAALDQSYWLYAESGNEQWNPETHPYQCHLKSIIENNSTVVDFGCGSAHPIKNLQDKHIQYIGIEWSEKQVNINRSQYPDSRFICGDITRDHELTENADWAVSFFALEHCVRPHVLLKRMYESVKPGGKVAIICPNFIYWMNSLRSGFRSTTKRDKLRKLQLLDLIFSYYQERVVLPKRVQAIHQSSIQFPIYLRPRCLSAPYYSDNDAVYLVSESKVAEYLKKLGGTILHSSASLGNHLSGDSVIMYLVVQKPLVMT